MRDGLRPFLTGLFRTAVEAAHPSSFLPALLPTPPKGRIIVLAAGKAAGSMGETAERHYLDTLKLPTERLAGIAVARHGYGRPTRGVTMIEASKQIFAGDARKAQPVKRRLIVPLPGGAAPAARRLRPDGA